jgi:UDP-glucose 4-epimerase
MNKKKVIVTGGMGYIGSHTCVALIDEGYEVIIIDNLSNAELTTLDGIEKITGVKPLFHEIDLQDTKATTGTFLEYKDAIAVIHFAALKAVGESVDHPIKYYKNNILSLVNVMEAMKQATVPKLIFSSSCTVYGQAKELPVSESSPILKANSPYGNTKQICEEILIDESQTETSISSISLRYFNPIGAHPSAIIGELPLGVPNNLMPYITQTAAGIRTELSVFGSDYNTPDGTAIRDYIHVMDLAQAHIDAMKKLMVNSSNKKYDCFNVGTGNGISVLEVIQSFEKMSGKKLKYRLAPRRAGDVEAIYAQTEKSNKELGWKPKYNLDDMTDTAWKWQQSLGRKKV